MRGAERVVVAFCAAREARQAAALAQGPDPVAPAGEDLVRIGLVADVPDEAVAGRIEDVMQADGQLDDAEAGPDVPDMASKFCATGKEAQVDGVILFPIAGPRAVVAFAGSAYRNRLLPIVGGDLPFPDYNASGGGYVIDDALDKIFRKAIEVGVDHFVIPGNTPDKIRHHARWLVEKVERPFLFVPGIGALGGIVLAAAYGALNFTMLRDSVYLTARATAMVCYLFIGSGTFSSIFAYLGGQAVIEQFFIGLDLSATQFLLLTQTIIFLLGWPLEWTEIIIIFVPIFLPLLDDFGVDPIFFGILVALNTQTAFNTPPVAMAAFYLKGVAPPHVKLTDIFSGALPFVFMVFLTMALVYVFPGLALWLPDYLYTPR